MWFKTVSKVVATIYPFLNIPYLAASMLKPRDTTHFNETSQTKPLVGTKIFMVGVCFGILPLGNCTEQICSSIFYTELTVGYLQLPSLVTRPNRKIS